jgi:hypothetical protein
MSFQDATDGSDADDNIPSGITVPRGLPPCRAALARYMSYRGQVSAEITRLEAGRDKLVLELARADAAKLQAETAFDAEASTLAERLASGVEGLLSTFARKPAPVPDVRLAKAALAKLEADLTAKLALAGRLSDRYSEFVNAALREEGAGLAAEYLATLDQLRSCIAKLHSLDVACGGPGKRDVRAMLPGFSAAGQPMRSIQVGPADEAVSAGVMSWRALGKAWASDPKASPRAHLKFRLRDRPKFTA